ncbi:MAG: glycosyltransferase [Balneolaceae bacterium]|nr:glycosyltransferase [Balneolaceae bacterium]
MKVGYIAPMSIAAVNGGLRNQALCTIGEVKKLGVNTQEITPWTSIENRPPDLVHIFGATVENIGIAKNLQALEIPFVVSPVFFSNRSASTIKLSINLELLTHFLGSGIRSDFSVKAQICQMANHVVPNTLEEASMVEKGFSVHSSAITVVPNGVEKRFAEASDDLFSKTYGVNDFILFAGDAGAPRKNVHMLLETANTFQTPIVIIGSFADNEYGQKCRKLADKADHVQLIKTLDHSSDMLASAYAAARVFVLPSYFETPGIAAMEAALAGARIVITEKGGTKEYFRDFAEYINPNSKASLAEAIQKALAKPTDHTLKNHLLQHFGWNQVAKQTVDVYKQLCP